MNYENKAAGALLILFSIGLAAVGVGLNNLPITLFFGITSLILTISLSAIIIKDAYVALGEGDKE